MSDKNSWHSPSIQVTVTARIRCPNQDRGPRRHRTCTSAAHRHIPATTAERHHEHSLGFFSDEVEKVLVKGDNNK